MNERINDLENRIYLTWRARIVSSERLKKRNDFLQAISLYYSLFVVILSIWNMVYSQQKLNVPTALLIFSVISFAFSVFIYSCKYYERYLHFKQNYVSLNKLYNIIQKLKNSSNICEEDIENIALEYTDLLDEIENHSTLDFYISVLGNKIYMDKLDFRNKLGLYANVYLYRIFILFVILILLAAPFALPKFIEIIDTLIKNIDILKT